MKIVTVALLLFCITLNVFAQSAGAYLLSLPNNKAYEKIKGKPLSDNYSEVNAVKLCFDIKSTL
jgi:hypothetical protein